MVQRQSGKENEMKMKLEEKNELGWVGGKRSLADVVYSIYFTDQEASTCLYFFKTASSVGFSYSKLCILAPVGRHTTSQQKN